MVLFESIIDGIRAIKDHFGRTMQKIWVSNKPTGKVTQNAKALASQGLTYHDVVALRRDAKEIDLVSPVSTESMLIRYRSTEHERSIMGITPAYSPMNDFH